MIVQTTHDHIDEILMIERSSFNRPWAMTHFTNDINRTDISYNYVYIGDNKTVLAFLFGYKIIDEYHLNNIAVNPDFRRRKIGSNMLNYLIDQMTKLCVQTIKLEVSARNEAAIHLYKSKGFYPVGIRNDYYSKGDDAILFSMEMKSNG